MIHTGSTSDNDSEDTSEGTILTLNDVIVPELFDFDTREVEDQTIPHAVRGYVTIIFQQTAIAPGSVTNTQDLEAPEPTPPDPAIPRRPLGRETGATLCLKVVLSSVFSAVEAGLYSPFPFLLSTAIRYHPQIVREGYSLVATGACITGAATGVLMGAFAEHLQRSPKLHSIIARWARRARWACFVVAFLCSIPMGSQVVELPEVASVASMIEDQIIGSLTLVGAVLMIFFIRNCISCCEMANHSHVTGHRSAFFFRPPTTESGYIIV
jgi:hypothetical protein